MPVVCDGDICRRVDSGELEAPAVADVFKGLGETLLGKDGAKVPVASITGPNKIIALYFSAHWCPPCRGFTPHLASIYKDFKAKHPRAADWEVVFVSSDRDEKSFQEYFDEMPWLALPFEDREAKAALSQKYKVRGIPTLVILDGATGELITANGRDAVGDDPACDNFPWRPRTLAQIMDGCPLVPAAGGEPIPNALEAMKGKVTLFYFSASWCPPCRRFTPKLVEAVAKLREAGKEVLPVFVSGDRDVASFSEYHGHMTWPALHLEEQKQRIAELNMLYEVEGIPTLVVVDEQLKTITTEGTGAVAADPACAKFPWRPQPLERLSDFNVRAINAGKALLLVLDSEDEAAAEALAQDALGKVAAGVKAGPDAGEWAFNWSVRSDELAQRVLAFAGVGKAGKEGEWELPKGNLLALLDVPSQVTWNLTAKYDVSKEGLAKVVADAKAGALGAGRKLGEEEDEE